MANQELTVKHPEAVVSNFNSPDSMRASFDVMLKSGALPKHIKNFETGFLVAKMGAELGFAQAQSFQYIISVQGNLTLSAKGVGILLKREGYSTKVIHDAAYVLEDKSYEKIIDLQIVDGKRIDALTGKRVLDRITVIQYRRRNRYGEIEEGEVDYFLSDAQRAGLTDKDVWVKYPKDMLRARAMTKLAKEVNLLLLPETEELAAALGETIELDEDGVPTISID